MSRSALLAHRDIETNSGGPPAARSCLAFVALRLTRYGAFVYAIGDNPLASRNSGMSIRPMTVLMYSFASSWKRSRLQVQSTALPTKKGWIFSNGVGRLNLKLACSTASCGWG